jgi:hypothetical protein
MMILWSLGNYQPFCRLQTWMLERLIAAQFSSADLRWGLLALTLSLAAAMWAAGRRRLSTLRRGRTSGSPKAADTMVAAAQR